MTSICVATKDALLIARRASGLWHTERHLTGLQPQCLAADPQHPERIYCGTFGSGLWRSADSGRTWHPCGEGVSYSEITAVAVSNNERFGERGVVYAGTEPSALFRSEDEGRTWVERETLRQIPSAPTWSFPPRPQTSHVRSIALDVELAGRIYAGIELGGVMRSADGGLTWQDRTTTGPMDTHTILTHPRAPGKVYAAAGDGYAESADGGTTWDWPEQGLRHSYLWGLAIDPADPEVAIVSAASGPYQAHSLTSANGTIYRKAKGMDWHETRPVREAHGSLAYSLAANPAEAGVFYAASNLGVFRSPDGGQSWDSVRLDWPESYERQHVEALIVVAAD